jgi:hypothetical protein
MCASENIVAGRQGATDVDRSGLRSVYLEQSRRNRLERRRRYAARAIRLLGSKDGFGLPQDVTRLRQAGSGAVNDQSL